MLSPWCIRYYIIRFKKLSTLNWKIAVDTDKLNLLYYISDEANILIIIRGGMVIYIERQIYWIHTYIWIMKILNDWLGIPYCVQSRKKRYNI